MTEIRKNEERSRYELLVEGEVVGYLSYVAGEDAIDLPHTVVDPAHGGKGYAGELVRHGLDDIRGQGKKVIPTCSYVAGYIQKHPEYEDLLQ